MINIQVIPFNEIEEAEWTVFHQTCIDPVVFYQYPFLQAFSDVSNEKVDVLAYKENGKLLIALPGKFDKKRNVFVNLTFYGWDNLNLLIVKNIDEAVLKNFFKNIYKIVDLVIYKNISESCYKLLNNDTTNPVCFKGFKCPYINLPNSYNDYIESLSVSFKRMIKNRTNFCDKHGVTFRFLTNKQSNSFEDAFQELKRLHQMRMDKIDTLSKFLRPNSQLFHNKIRENNKEEFILIIQAVENEKVIGTLYGFVSANQYAYFASGIDPSYSKYSLGIVMISKVIDYLISHKIQRFDFLRGTEDYKYKWTNYNNQNRVLYSFLSIKGRIKALKHYWFENKIRLGRKQTLIDMKLFFKIF